MRRLRIAGWLALIPAAAIFVFAVARPVQVLPRVAAAPPFELVDPWGTPLLAPAGADRIAIYTFGALRDAAGMDRVKQLYREAGAALTGAGFGDSVRFVYITVDPDHDSPEALRRAAEELAAEAAGAGTEGGSEGGRLPEFTFLTGSWVAVRMTVGAGFGVYYDAGPGQGSGPGGSTSGPPAYDPVVIVVDKDHVIRARYALGQATPEVLVRDIRLLTKEASATGASRWVYEGAHLFLCYPR